jgi:hypothetical protein
MRVILANDRAPTLLPPIQSRFAEARADPSCEASSGPK